MSSSRSLTRNQTAQWERLVENNLTSLVSSSCRATINTNSDSDSDSHSRAATLPTNGLGNGVSSKSNQSSNLPHPADELNIVDTKSRSRSSNHANKKSDMKPPFNNINVNEHNTHLPSKHFSDPHGCSDREAKESNGGENRKKAIRTSRRFHETALNPQDRKYYISEKTESKGGEDRKKTTRTLRRINDTTTALRPQDSKYYITEKNDECNVPSNESTTTITRRDHVVGCTSQCMAMELLHSRRPKQMSKRHAEMGNKRLTQTNANYANDTDLTYTDYTERKESRDHFKQTARTKETPIIRNRILRPRRKRPGIYYMPTKSYHYKSSFRPLSHEMSSKQLILHLPQGGDIGDDIQHLCFQMSKGLEERDTMHLLEESSHSVAAPPISNESKSIVLVNSVESKRMPCFSEDASQFRSGRVDSGAGGDLTFQSQFLHESGKAVGDVSLLNTDYAGNAKIQIPNALIGQFYRCQQVDMTDEAIGRGKDVTSFSIEEHRLKPNFNVLKLQVNTQRTTRTSTRSARTMHRSHVRQIFKFDEVDAGDNWSDSTQCDMRSANSMDVAKDLETTKLLTQNDSCLLKNKEGSKSLTFPHRISDTATEITLDDVHLSNLDSTSSRGRDINHDENPKQSIKSALFDRKLQLHKLDITREKEEDENSSKSKRNSPGRTMSLNHYSDWQRPSEDDVVHPEENDVYQLIVKAVQPQQTYHYFDLATDKPFGAQTVGSCRINDSDIEHEPGTDKDSSTILKNVVKSSSNDDLNQSSLECLLEQLIQRGKITKACIINLKREVMACSKHADVSPRDVKVLCDGAMGRYDGMMKITLFDDVVYTCIQWDNYTVLIGRATNSVLVSKLGYNSLVAGFAPHRASGSCMKEITEFAEVLKGRGL